MARTTRVLILGSTGSIGTQALDVVTHLNALHEQRARDGAGIAPDAGRFEVVGLAAGKSRAALLEQAARFGVRELALCEPAGADELDPAGAPAGTRLRRGPACAERLVREVECDMVVAAIVGAAGIAGTLAALELGRDVALANKETLVAAGAAATETARRTGAAMHPVDSEHAALWQCLAGCLAGLRAGDGAHVGAAPPLVPGGAHLRTLRRAWITASGGPFRGAEWTRERLARVRPEEALRHPTWTMGAKVTIDSATLVNKSLEIVEAAWLFALPASMLGVKVHPQSIVHALVERLDGALLAQMATPDMRLPIQAALTRGADLPRTVGAGGAAAGLDWTRCAHLEFHEPDAARFPGVLLGQRVLREGGTSGATMNAANEEAVGAFLRGDLAFTRIAEVAAEALDALPARPAPALGDVLEADRVARAWARARVGRTAAAVG